MNAFTPKMASSIELWPTNKLHAYAFNARTHSDEQVDKIAASIAEFGFLAPIILDQKDGTIIAGHGRLMAAMRLGFIEVPVVPVGHLTEAQRRAYVLADNRLAEEAGWDQDLLTHELEALAAESDELLGLAGFDDDELAELLGEDDGKPATGAADPSSYIPDPDAAMPPRQEPAAPPANFQEFTDDVETQYCCPACRYEWSGKPK